MVSDEWGVEEEEDKNTPFSGRRYGDIQINNTFSGRRHGDIQINNTFSGRRYGDIQSHI